MKVIFLDIDGVLNCKSTPNPRGFPYIVDPGLLARYLHLAASTDAKTVLLSTWRHDPAGQWSARYYGVPFFDVIPDMPGKPTSATIISVFVSALRRSSMPCSPLSASITS